MIIPLVAAAPDRQNRQVKLIIQIPCYNEEQALPVTLDALPRSLPGVHVLEWLIIDDGSSDRTVEVARSHGVDHIVRLPGHKGLAKAFEAGLEACLAAGADIIVNTDADNQYSAADIPRLIAPILEGRSEIVVGARPIADIEHFSRLKKQLQRFGSQCIRWASSTRIPDAPSGFRAISREAAQRMYVVGDYTYTLETIIQAGRNNLSITSVDVGVNAKLRDSRLMSNMFAYLWKSGLTAVRAFVTYRPLRFFATIGGALLAIGALLCVRFLSFYLAGEGDGHVQSLILAAVLILLGAQIGLLGVVADLISVNRKLLERIDWKLRERNSERRNTDPETRSLRVARDG